jgi:hypothetical protein
LTINTHSIKHFPSHLITSRSTKNCRDGSSRDTCLGSRQSWDRFFNVSVSAQSHDLNVLVLARSQDLTVLVSRPHSLSWKKVSTPSWKSWCYLCQFTKSNNTILKKTIWESNNFWYYWENFEHMQIIYSKITI